MSAKPKATPQVCNTEQAATFLGFSVRTLRDWRLRKVGPPFFRQGIGKNAAVMYHRADLESFRDELMTARTP
jgi:hypothetical protein